METNSSCPGSPGEESGRVSRAAYYGTFAGLCALLALTVFLSSLDLGAWNTVAAVGIGAAKALLIVLFFMHLKVDRPILRVLGLAILIWLGILFTLTLTDYFARLPFSLPLR